MQVVGQQAVRAKEAQERAAVQRLQRAKDDQANRVSALQQQAENAETKVLVRQGVPARIMHYVRSG